MNKKRFKNGKNKQGLKLSFSISHRDFFQTTSAERESDLENYYLDNLHYQSAVNPESKKVFFIGRTGIGKTAILKKVENKKSPPKKNIITIDPEEFAFKIIARSQILKGLASHDINMDLFYKTMWKYIFVTEILKEIHGTRKKNWFEKQMLKFNSKPILLRGYKFLLENNELDEGISFNEKIEKIINKMERSLKATIDLGILSLSYKKTLTNEEEKGIYNALRQFEFTDINHFLKHLDNDILNKYGFTILVDDLDKMRWTPFSDRFLDFLISRSASFLLVITL